MCKFLLMGSMQIICKISLQNLCNLFSYIIDSAQNLTTESGSKQRFSLEKVLIQAVCLMTQAVIIKARF